MTDLELIEQYENKLKAYSLALNTIFFDHETAAPKDGTEYRFKCIDILEEEFYKIRNDESICEALLRLKDSEDKILNRKVKLMLKDFEDLKKIPSDLYLKYSSLRNKAQLVWEKAKNKNDYALFEPYLIELINMTKEVCHYRNPDINAYELMLNDFEEGMNTEKYDEFFNLVKSELVPLIQKIKEKQLIDDKCIKGNFKTADQKKVQELIKKYLNFDPSWGLMAEYMHPFTSGFSTGDVRVTTFYRENDFTDAIFSSIHEIGHATYEHNLPKDYEGTVLNNVSSGLHESQSRLFENYLGRNPHFWDSLFPEIKKILNLDCDQDAFVKAINKSVPSLIRTAADELTYPIHILIRYEMEKAIFKDGIDLKNLNKIWNEYYKKYLGVDVDTDANGILQDVHWSNASFGYFPTYALGSAYAAQFVYYMRKELDVDKLLSEGKMEEIADYLKEHIHKYGNTVTPSEVIIRATGESFNPKYYIEYLKEKYTKLYEIA